MSSIFEEFKEYCLFSEMALQAATNLFHAKSEGTIRSYIDSAKMIQMQSYITGQKFDPLSAVSVINVLQSCPWLEGLPTGTDGTNTGLPPFSQALIATL